MKKAIIFIGMAMLVFLTPVCARDLSYYEQECACNPHDSKALYNAGVMAFKSGDWEKAKKVFDCLKMRCQDQEWDVNLCEQVYYNAGNAEVKLKNYHDALASFEKVLRYNPDNSIAQKKRDYVKSMLDQQKQEQSQEHEQQENDHNNDQSQDDQSDDKKDNNENPDEPSSENNDDKKDDTSSDTHDDHEQDKSDKDNNQNSQKKDSKNDEGSSDDSQDSSDKQSSDANDQNPKSQDPKNQNNNASQKNSGGGDGDDHNTKDCLPEQGPDLTHEEKRLLAGLENLDKEMNKQQAVKMLRGVAGRGVHEKNW